MIPKKMLKNKILRNSTQFFGAFFVYMVIKSLILTFVIFKLLFNE